MNGTSSQARECTNYHDIVTAIVRQTLQLSDDTALSTQTRLVGSLPEFDSMSVVTVLTALEEHFDFFIDDDELSAETFETVGTLVAFVQEKVESG